MVQLKCFTKKKKNTQRSVDTISEKQQVKVTRVEVFKIS